jgi:hypothetical protein
LCGFKLLILLVDSFPNVVNVIMSNSMILKQKKNYIDGSFIIVVIYKKVVLALSGFKTYLLLFSRFLELIDSVQILSMPCATTSYNKWKLMH